MVLARQIFSAGTKPPTVAEIVAGVPRPVARQVFSSAHQALLSLTSVAGDKTLPSIVIPVGGIAGTVTRALLAFSFREVENTNASVNQLSGAQDIQFKKSGGAFVDAINFVTQEFVVPAVARGGGDLKIGTIDLTSTVTGDGTYASQWDEGIVLGNNLIFYDTQMHLIVESRI